MALVSCPARLLPASPLYCKVVITGAHWSYYQLSGGGSAAAGTTLDMEPADLPPPPPAGEDRAAEERDTPEAAPPAPTADTQQVQCFQ